MGSICLLVIFFNYALVEAKIMPESVVNNLRIPNDGFATGLNKLDDIEGRNYDGAADDEPNSRHRRQTEFSVVNACSRQQPPHLIDPNKVWESNDFCELVLYGNGIYVDKSLLVLELVNADESSPIVKRPSGFGKTVNLDMLRRFFEQQVDQNGNPIPPEHTLNHKLFVGGEIEVPANEDGSAQRVVHLPPLKVAEHSEVMQYQGRCPVISVSFKDIYGATYNDIADKTRRLMADLFHQYGYLRDGISQAKDREQFDRLYAGTATDKDLEQSLYFLSGLLHERYEVPAHIFVDDHDSPAYDFFLTVNESLPRFNQSTNETITDPQDCEEYIQYLNLFGGIMVTAFRKTHHIRQGLITGFAMSQLFDNTVVDEQLSPYFGFNEFETTGLLSKLPFQTDRQIIERFYCNYNFGFWGETFCMPYALMRFLSNGGKLEYYALNSKNTTWLDRYVLDDWFQPTMQDLLAGNHLFSVVQTVYAFRNVELRVRVINLLLFYGLLRPVWFKQYTAEFCLPNEEVRHFYEAKIEQWLDGKLNIDRSRKNSVTDTLLGSNDVREFKHILNQTLLDHFPQFPRSGNDTDRLFKVILRSLLKSPECRITSLSRSVLFVEPQSERYESALIAAIGVVQDDDKVAAALKDGLTMVTDKKYDNRLKRNGRIKKLLRLCLIFNDLEVNEQHRLDNLSSGLPSP